MITKKNWKTTREFLIIVYQGNLQAIIRPSITYAPEIWADKLLSTERKKASKSTKKVIYKILKFVATVTLTRIDGASGCGFGT